jgi:hypothetical protein
MRVVLLCTFLLTVAILLAGASTSQAQDGGLPARTPNVGADRNRLPSTQACGGSSPAVCTRNDQGGVVPGCAAFRGNNLLWCSGLPAGYGGCPSPYAVYDGPSYGSWASTRYNSSANSPHFAAGGEAYSYAGYGDCRSLGYGAGTSSPYGAYGTTASAGCGSSESGPAVLPSNASTTPQYPNRAPDARQGI